MYNALAGLFAWWLTDRLQQGHSTPNSGMSEFSVNARAKLRFGHGRGRESRKVLRRGSKAAVTPGRIPRISRLMALAIRFDQMIRDGFVADYAKLARLGHVTRARMTQIMDLLNLAPDIQERLLFLPPVERGKDTITERQVRGDAAEADWRRQRSSKVLRSM